MADYIYLLENRLSQPQKRAISAVREIARVKGLTVFLVGGAVRDLTSGSPVRDLDVAVQGNALKLKKELEKAGAVVTGENEPYLALYLRFPGSVRMEVGSALSVTFPKPGKPIVKPANILDDLRRRDFTANAMALSLNQGSYGLLMDPLNGVADIENRELRLVSNYGFIEDPVRMVRAARFAARLGWQLEEKTKARYETGKSDGYISEMSKFQRGYEAEEIVHEEDPLRVMRGLEHEGWMKVLAPAWTSAKVNVVELDKLRDAQMQLQMQGIHADPSAAQFPLLTAKMAPKDVTALKKSFPRQGFVAEIAALEGEAKKFAAELGSKQSATPSAAWKLLMSAKPEAVLWVAYSTKSAPLQAKFKSFYTDWPQARQKVPYVLMQEMRIVPDLPGYDELVEKIFFEVMDGKLGTPEEMKAFLEPYSPPAPPPPVHLRRARATKKESKASKSRKKSGEVEAVTEGAEGPLAIDLAASGGTDREEAALATVVLPKAPPTEKTAPVPSKSAAPRAVEAKSIETKLASKRAEKRAVPVKPPAKPPAPAKAVARPATKPAAKKLPAKAAVKAKPKPAAKPPKKAVAKGGAKVAAKAKSKPGKPAGKSTTKQAKGKSKKKKR
jgi:tRNA nucleotidyltransferase/poly(A) polymerase